MTELPDPLVPAYCDLRDYDWMPLHGNFLFSSYFDAHANDAEFRAGLRLWWESFRQLPAASLPDDDAVLCKAAGWGRDMKSWKKLRTMALHGFIKCNDGRLYHRFLANEAVIAYERKLRADKKRTEDRKRLQEWRDRKKKADPGADGNGEGNDDGNAGGNERETGSETRFVGRRPDQTRPYSVLRTAPGQPVPDENPEIWSRGLAVLVDLTGRSEAKARQLLGGFAKSLADDPAALSQILEAASCNRPVDPVSWIKAAIATQLGERRPPDRQAESIAEGLAALGVDPAELERNPRLRIA